MRAFYLIAAVFGLIVPYIFLGLFLTAYGLDLSLFAHRMFANPIAGFFSVDVLISSLVLWGFVYSEGPRYQMKNLWFYVLLNLLVGVSFALPVFLYFREGKRLEQSRQ